MKKLLISIFFALTALLAACGSLEHDSIWTQPPTPALPIVETADIPTGNFTPGTFIGVGSGGWGGDVHVAVTFSETDISSVEVAQHNETASFAYPAFDQLVSQIINTQSANVDTVTGATSTSNAFIEAVRNAIAQSADGAPAPPPPPPLPCPDCQLLEAELVQLRFELAQALLALEATELEAGNADPVERFIAGNYIASAEGFSDTIVVSVEFDNYRIESITITDHNETDYFFEMVVPVLLNNIIAAQSTDVPNISGATATASAIKQAVETAIQQAANLE